MQHFAPHNLPMLNVRVRFYVSIKRYPYELKKSRHLLRMVYTQGYFENNIMHGQNVVIENRLREMFRKNGGALEVAFSIVCLQNV